VAWFAPLCSSDAVSHLYLAEYSVNGGADVSDFIAAAGQITPNLALVHAQYATKATGGQNRRSLSLNNSLADVTMGYLQSYLVLQCDNIFVLPGVPQYYAAKIDIIVRHVLSHKRRQHSRKIVLDLDEGALVSVLGRLVAEHRDVKFGSYPFVDHPEFKTIITLEGADRDGVEAAVAGLLAAVPTNVVLRVEKGMAARRM
jgi:hypothetical protein